MTTIRQSAVRAVTVIVAGVVLALTACMPDASTPPPPKDDPVQTKTMAEIVKLAETRAKAAAEVAGSALDRWRTNTVPCVGRGGETAEDGRWSLTGFGGLVVEPVDQLPTLAKIKAAWQQQGYEITEDRTFAEGARGALSARDPGTGLTFTLTTSVQKTQIALVVASACYLPAGGENPAEA